MGKIYLITLEANLKELKFYVVAEKPSEAVEKIIRALSWDGNYGWSEDDLKAVEVIATQYRDDVFE